MNVEDFEDWSAICEVKARYCRFLDTKQWDAWGALFTEDLVLDTSEAGGGAPTTTRDAAVALVSAFLNPARTAHHVHTPEITLAGERAEGIWAMQDRVMFEGGHGFLGYGHYTETYVKRDGKWRISHSKLTRLHIDPIAPPA